MTDQPTPATPATPDAEVTPEKSAKRKKRRWPKVLLALVAIVVLFVALLPTLVSTGPGTRAALGMAGGAINGRVTLDDLSVGWLTGTSVRGLEVFDADRDVQVVNLASLDSDLTVLGMLRGAIGGTFDFGDTSLAVNLPSVAIYPDGTTSLDRTFPSDPDAEPYDELPIRGDITIERFEATVQQVDEAGNPLRDEVGNAMPYIGVAMDDATLAIDRNAITNDLTAALSVNAAPAGTFGVAGTADAGEVSAKQNLSLDAVQLAAVNTLADAFAGGLGVVLDGVASGSFAVDTDAGTLGGKVEVADFAVTPVDGGEGYATSQATLELDGEFTGEGDEQVALVRSLRLSTSNGGADLSALIYPGLVEAQGPLAVRDVRVNANLPFLTADGGGASLGGLNLNFTADADALQRTFGDFAKVEGVDYAGKFDGTLQTQTRNDGIGTILKVNASDVVVAGGEGEPLRLSNATIGLTAILAENQQVEMARATVEADDWLAIDVLANTLDGKAGRVEGVTIGRIALTDYAAAKRALGGWAELPELEGDPGVVEVTGDITSAGPTGENGERMRVLFPELIVIADGNRVLQLGGHVETAAEAGEVADFDLAGEADVASARTLAVAFGSDLSDVGGRVAFALKGGYGGDRTAEGTLKLLDLAGPGVVAAGELPLRIVGTSLQLGDDATLAVNDGTLALGGTTADLDAMRLSLPAGDLASAVNLNPVLVDQLGQYVNFIFADPQAATGLLDLRLPSGASVDLSDPLASDVEIAFAVRDLSLENDVIGELAQSVAEQAGQAVLGKAGRLSSVPGFNVGAFVREQLNVDEEVREEIGTLRGEIVDSTVTLTNGVAATKLTLNARDPRREKASDPAVYPLTFTGDVNVETLAIGLSLTVPRNLIEKWVDDDSADLVEVLGEQPIERVAPEGVRLGFGGTTLRPTVDARASAEAVAGRAIEAALENAGTNLLRRGIDDLFGR